MKTAYIDLLLNTGEIVRIELPEKYSDDAHQTLEDAMKRRDWWSRKQFDGCQMTIVGILVNRVNMGAVVAML